MNPKSYEIGSSSSETTARDVASDHKTIGTSMTWPTEVAIPTYDMRKSWEKINRRKFQGKNTH
jgi:hypothetical protein